MSGRSAGARKKIVQVSKSKGKDRGPNKAQGGPPSYEEFAAQVADYGAPQGPSGTGVGTTNARFLKFTEPVQSPHFQGYYQDDYEYGGHDRREGGGSVHGGRSYGSGGEGGSSAPYTYGQYSSHHGEDHAFGRGGAARRTTMRTEDVSGIERSGLRTMLDKRSDGVRKGLAKTFAFKKKGSTEGQTEMGRDRPNSSSTIRREGSMSQDGYPMNIPPVGTQIHHPEHHSSPPTDPNNPFKIAVHTSIQTHTHYADEEDRPSPTPTPGLMRSNSDLKGLRPPPSTSGSSRLVPTRSTAPPRQAAQAAVLPPIKRWIGAGRPVVRWNKLRKDPELWDPNGDVLVFLGHKGQSPRPPPSFRLSSHIIEATESRYLITMLMEGSSEDDDIYTQPWSANTSLDEMRRGKHHPHNTLIHGASTNGQPTPPLSDDATFEGTDGQISYEMYFPTPYNLNPTESLRHQLTTRNMFAILYHASLVGLSLYQALADLHDRLDSYMPPDSDNVGLILGYLCARSIEDVRCDPETAVSLLAWSEGQEVRWEEGWREFFVHCAGMYADLEICADYKCLTPITRALLERAALETQLRIQAAEERLEEFSYGDMWTASNHPALQQAKGAADRLHLMLLDYYTRVYGNWPPPSQSRSPTPSDVTGRSLTGIDEDTWLTRLVAMNLQKDFAALYDYLVNRDVGWDVSEARTGRKWVMRSQSNDPRFEADVPGVPIMDIVVEFDKSSRFPHIPHPFPLIPESSAAATTPGANSGLNGTGQTRTSAIDRRVHLAYTEATNIYTLGTEFTQSDLIDTFIRFEKGDKVGEVDPAIARRGRWVLIYGVLQTLASVSVDSPGVRWRDGVVYHLSPRLKGTRVPPWKAAPSVSSKVSADVSEEAEASHELSHCWVVPGTWEEVDTGDTLEGEFEDRDTSVMTASRVELSPVDGQARAAPRSHTKKMSPRQEPPMPRAREPEVEKEPPIASIKSLRSINSSALTAPSITSSSDSMSITSSLIRTPSLSSASGFHARGRSNMSQPQHKPRPIPGSGPAGTSLGINSQGGNAGVPHHPMPRLARSREQFRPPPPPKAPSMSSASGYEAPAEWDVVKKGRKESMSGDNGSLSPSVPLMAKASQSRMRHGGSEGTERPIIRGFD